MPAACTGTHAHAGVQASAAPWPTSCMHESCDAALPPRRPHPHRAYPMHVSGAAARHTGVVSPAACPYQTRIWPSTQAGPGTAPARC
eukprot:365847-Chlamydomonas_euryale.AAC.5